jgi:CheY-like chemotaxis protein
MFSAQNKPSLKELALQNKITLEERSTPATSSTTPHTSAALKMPASEKKLILVVEDNNTNLSVFSKFIQAKNYPLLTVHDGEQALFFYEKFREVIGIIFMDQNIPKLSGLDVTKHIRANEKSNAYPEVPIIFISGVQSTVIEQEILAAGANKFMPKPFERTLIRDEIEHYLHKTPPKPPLISCNFESPLLGNSTPNYTPVSNPSSSMSPS